MNDPRTRYGHDALFSALCDGQLDAATRARLCQRLVRDRELRRAYVRFVDLHAEMATRYGSAPAAPGLHVTASGSGGAPSASSVLAKISPRRIAALAIAAAVLMAAAGVIIALGVISRSPDGEPDSIPAPAIATLVWADAAIEADEPIMTGQSFGPQTIRSRSGDTEFRLTSGATIELRGRSHLTLHSPMAATFTRGSATFDCPPQAHGFTVHLPDRSKVIDLGTKFEVSIKNETRTVVSVSEGRVAIERSGADRVEITAGYVAMLGPDGIDIRPMPAYTAYVVPPGAVGNQAFTGAKGMDFVVDRSITVTHLGAFDSGGDGLKRPITVTLYRRDDRSTPDDTTDDTGESLVSVVIADHDGELIGGSRFIPLEKPITLAAGGAYSIVTSGHGPGEPGGNLPPEQRGWSTDDGDGALRFVGSGRYSGADHFPTTVPPTGDPTRYAAGTFRFAPAALAAFTPREPDPSTSLPQENLE